MSKAYKRMTQALLDVNVLIALLDRAHVHHMQATAWLAGHLDGNGNWASCPLTQNGCIRIMSQPAYPNARSPGDIATRLREATMSPAHVFWADELSLLDNSLFDWQHLFHPRQLTDAYLLALAVQRGGIFVTFGHVMPLRAVNGATADHVFML